MAKPDSAVVALFNRVVNGQIVQTAKPLMRNSSAAKNTRSEAEVANTACEHQSKHQQQTLTSVHLNGEHEVGEEADRSEPDVLLFHIAILPTEN